MDTKRCAYCHKLVRADAQTCSRCGRAFVQRTSLPDQTRPSIPPASPHRAGHFSGLHPEDQPYQSSKMAAQHPPRSDDEQRPRQHHEPEHIVLPIVEAPTRVEKRSARLEKRTEVTLPALYTKIPTRMRKVSFPPYMPRKPLFSERAIPVMLGLSCIFLLLAGSITAFALIGKKPLIASAAVSASPNVLRVNDAFTLSGQGFASHDLVVFTHDLGEPIYDGNKSQMEAIIGDDGRFSVQIRVPGDWKVGQHTLLVTDQTHNLSISTTITIQQPPPTPPSLQLSTTSLSFASDAPGVVSNKTITLENTGGGQVIWQGSSDSPWLTTLPNSGSFSGRTDVQVKINRGNLAPKTYTGHIRFTQQSATRTITTLNVTMAVKPAPAQITVSTTTLAYSASTAQNPAAQVIVLQNSGGEPMDWSSSVTTGDGAHWIFVFPASGRLNPNTSETITVSVQSQQLAVGSYWGTINFTKAAQVTVTLSVVAPGNLVVSPPALDFNALIGQPVAAKTLTIQNSGGTALSWTASASTVDGSKWLNITPTAGSLNAGMQANVTVNINSAGLKPGSYQGTLALTSGTLVKQVAVSLAVTSPPMPAISIQPSSLTFTTFKGTNPDAQSLTLSNTGNAPLNWNATAAGNAATMIAIAPAQGTLPAGQSTQLTVSPNVAGSSAGDFSATITITDSDAGSQVPHQQVAVQISIKDQAAIAVSANDLSFHNTSSYTNTTQLLTIRNVGSASLHWTVKSSNPWLSVNIPNDTIVPGGAETIDVNCHSSDLTPGTYTATIEVSDSDSNTPVAPQTINIVLTVEQ